MEEKIIRALEVLDTYFPTFDGPTTLVSNYGKSMKKRKDMDVEVLVPEFKGYKDDPTFKVNRIKSVGAQENYRCALPFLNGKARKIIGRKEEPFDIIHAHSPFLLGRYAIKKAKKYKIPSVITLHTCYHEEFDRLLKSKALRRFMMKFIMKSFNRADYVICVSDQTVETLKSYGYKGKAYVIRNGTDLVYPENSAELIDKVNEKENLKGEENVFLSVGRIVENKKLDLCLDALKVLKDKGVKFKYIIVGSGSWEDNLKKKVKDYQMEDYVIFTGKIMDRQLLAGYYLRSDLFLFPSTFDTASLAPIEASALKLPTLMTKGCSTAEIITDNQNGFLEIGDSNAWADKILDIISDKKKLLEVKEKAYAEVYKTWDQVVEEMRKFYTFAIEDYNSKKK